MIGKPIGDKDVLNKKVPKTARYSHVKATIDSGLTIEKFLQKKGGESFVNARFRRLENFERIKNAELAKFVMLRHGEDEDCLYEEKPRTLIHRESQLLIPDDMISDQEMLTQRKTNRVNQVIHHRMLLLDVRDSEAYSKCHIEGALLYEAPRLSRSVNALTPELLAFKNCKDKIIVIYDWDEKIAAPMGNLFFEKGFDNVYLLSGGLQSMVDMFPQQLVGEIPVLPRLQATKRTGTSSSRSSVTSTPRSSVSLRSDSMRMSTTSKSQKSSVARSTSTPIFRP